MPTSEIEIESFRGYDYLLDALARMGFIAASINANDLNCDPGGDSLWAAGSELFGIHLDFILGEFPEVADPNRIVLVGHSRGGDRAIRATQLINESGAPRHVVATVGLAPPWNLYRPELQSPAAPTLLLYGAMDGDVHPYGLPESGSPIRLFDSVDDRSFVSVMVVDRANHNRFNTEWGGDGDLASVAGHMTGPEQRGVTIRNVVGWALWHTRGDSRWRSAFVGDSLIGRDAPPSLIRVSYSDPSDIVIDGFENHDDQQTDQGEPFEATDFASFEEIWFDHPDGPNASYAHRTSGAHVLTDGAAAEIWLAVAPHDPLDYRRHALTFRIARTASVGGPQPSAGPSFGVGAVFDDPFAHATVFVESSDLAPVGQPFSQIVSRPLTVLETVRVPFGCIEGLGTELNTVSLRIDPDQAVGMDRIAISRR